MGADVDARGTGMSPSPSPWPSCRVRFGGGGGHVLGERLLLLVVIRSRWEGVEGVQNVSAVGHARQSQMKRARVCAGLDWPWESSCVWEVSSTVSTLSFSSRVRLRRRVVGELSDSDCTRRFL